MFTTNETSKPMGPFSGVKSADVNPYGTMNKGDSIPSPLNPGNAGGGIASAIAGSRTAKPQMPQFQMPQMPNFGTPQPSPQIKPAVMPQIEPAGLTPEQPTATATQPEMPMPPAQQQAAQPQTMMGGMTLPPLNDAMSKLPPEL